MSVWRAHEVLRNCKICFFFSLKIETMSASIKDTVGLTATRNIDNSKESNGLFSLATL